MTRLQYQGRLNSLITAIEQRPAIVFAGFAVLHFAVWTALPAAIFSNPFMDVIEALTYGREWQLGHDKHPPLPWWTVEIVYRIFGHDAAYYALSQLIVIGAFTAVWKMATPLAGASGALVALLLLDGQNYFHFTAVKFNHNVMQLPFWAVAGYAYWSALRHNRMIHWVLLGLAMGLALWVKYFVLVLALPLGLFVLFDRNARKSLVTPGPYVAIAVAFLVAMPHLLWLVQTDFQPFGYAEIKLAHSLGPIDHALSPAIFIIGQLWYLLPTLLIALALVFPRGKKTEYAATDFDRRIVTLLAFGPATTLAVILFVTGSNTDPMWGYPFWLFLGLWYVLVPGGTLDRLRLTRVVTLWAIVFWGFAVSFVLNYTVISAYNPRYHALFQAFFPGDKLAAEISTRYRILTGQPLTYVIASMWIGGNIAHYAPEHPRVLIDGSPHRVPWIDLADMRSIGAVVVWTEDESADAGRGDPRVLPSLLRTIAKDAQVQEPFSLPYRRGPAAVIVGWAILRPQPAK